ncbi:PBP1A family penicillin-binding protein [Caloramator sp. E03]|uniref:transglycosylase domain-containing protein n=1 Tax=Caloramator sp. E03 TaxID=2576307 RepID=UPI001110788F|nr:PBP1A family penicillin-binding protein [Caloramator sp. E03]QCX34227.1 PBP1A family penicillin-binding protein [Caloramator sp. E03]
MEQESRRKRKKVKKKGSGIGKKFLIIILIIILLSTAAATGAVIAVLKSAPTLNTDIINNLKQSSKIYDMNGKYIEDFSGSENRNVVPLKQIPKNLQNAFVAIEDERFWTHHGIDIKRIFGALWYDIKTMSKAQGASTITQQLIKNYALSPKKNITRKIQEAYLAIQLERQLSKEQILEAYLNTILLGNNTWGVQAASMLYFGKDVSQLNLAECSLLAGITQNPSKYNPYSKKNTENPKDLLDRQKTVLSKMLELGYITKDEYDSALNYKLKFQSKQTAMSMKYQWFIEPAIEQIAKDFAEKYGMTESEAKQKLRIGGYNIYLTIDTNIQEVAQSVIDNDKYYSNLKLSKDLQYYSADGKSKSIVQPQAAAVIFDYKSGEVRAIVGGRGAHDLMSLNRATEVARQPGSSIKPLAVYGPAIDTKLATAGTVIEDSPMPSDFVKANKGWDPKNADGKFRGYITIRDAIKHSVNLVAVKLQLQVGVNTSINYLQNKFHITTIKNDDKNTAAMALGGMTEGVTPYEMAAAYGVFGNGGIYSEPIMYTKVTDRNGDVILEKTSEQSKSLSPQAAYIMTDMLKGVLSAGGTGASANLGAMPAAGKTGTASDNTNAWFCGFTPYYSGAIWIGHDQPKVKVTNLTSSLAARMWGDIMKQVHKNLDVVDFQVPSGIVKSEICIDSGKAPSDICAQDPRGSRIRSELFIDGTQPVEICDIHTTADIDIRTGKLASWDTPSEYISRKVFIKRDAKSRATLLDDPYVLPTELINQINESGTPIATP